MKEIRLMNSERMSSKEIAELTGKEHKNVMRDIRNLLEQGVQELNFELSLCIRQLPNGGSKEEPCYNLTKKGCLILASGYDALLREKIIDRWEELEMSQQRQKVPQTYKEALIELLAKVEANEKLQQENNLMRPKAEYFNNLVERNLLTNLRDTAKEMHVKQNVFIQWLLDNGYLYRDGKKSLKPYSQHTPDLFEVKEYSKDGHSGVQTLVTVKGKETFRLLLQAVY